MASPKPFCPVCGFATLKYQSGNVVEFGDNDLENARCTFYKCDYCGTRVRLDTPKGKLSVIPRAVKPPPSGGGYKAHLSWNFCLQYRQSIEDKHCIF